MSSKFKPGMIVVDQDGRKGQVIDMLDPTTHKYPVIAHIDGVLIAYTLEGAKSDPADTIRPYDFQERSVETPIIADHTDHLPQNRIGMTVREEIASRVLAGILTDSPPMFSRQAVMDAARYADALIRELERTKE